MAVHNLTPHPIVLRTKEGDVSIPSSGVARVVAYARSGLPLAPAGSPVPVAEPQIGGKLQGLPADVEPGDLVVVSGVVAAAVRDMAPGLARLRLAWSPEQEAEARVYLATVSPGTGPDDAPVREGGQVVAVTCLVYALPSLLRSSLRNRLSPTPETGHGAALAEQDRARARAAEPITSGGGHSE